MRFAPVALALAFAASAHAQEAVQFPTPARDNPVATIEGKVYRPAGDGPFPAVVLMHGCSGPTATVASWGDFFKANGYVALEVFGFRPRGIDEVCTKVASQSGISLRDRANDAHGGFAWLRQQPWVDARRVVVMGFSHGGSTTLTAASLGFPRPHPGQPDFAAAIPFYPGCYDFDLDASMPMRIIGGEADDWTPVAPCVRKGERARASGYDVEVSVMPNAHHGFDSPYVRGTWMANVRNGSKAGGCCGATVAGNTAARARSEREVLEFLKAKLRPAADQPARPSRPAMLADDVVMKTVRDAAALAPDAMLAAVNDAGGRYEGNRFHVFVLGPGQKIVAHARYPYLIGADYTLGRDDTGQPLAERVRAALDANGWGGYRINRTEVRLYAVRAGDRVVAGVRY